MLDMELIKERLAWDIRDTFSQFRELVAEVERLRDALEEIVGEPWLMGGQDACTIASDALAGPSHAKEGGTDGD
jgi:hypothetical protein